MDEKQVNALFSDEEFVKDLLNKETPEEAQAALKEKGLELSTEEIFSLRDVLTKTIEKPGGDSGELTMEDLDEVAGGGIGALSTVTIRAICVVAATIISATAATAICERWRW